MKSVSGLGCMFCIGKYQANGFQALILSASFNASHPEAQKSISVSTHGILFMGTPYIGGKELRLLQNSTGIGFVSRSYTNPHWPGSWLLFDSDHVRVASRCYQPGDKLNLADTKPVIDTVRSWWQTNTIKSGCLLSITTMAWKMCT